MDKTTKIIVAVVAVILVGGGALWLGTRQQYETDNNSTGNYNATQNSESGQQEGPVASVITYTADGFSVSKDTINAGEQVKVINNSEDELEFESDPHPAHTDNSELNTGSIAPGESKTFRLDKKGTWGFHNHLNAGHEGELTVR